MKIRYSLFAAVALVAMRVAATSASTIAYDNVDAGSTQNYPGLIGMDFQVNQSISVSSLGAYFGSSTSNLTLNNADGVEVGIFEVSSGNLLASTFITAATPGVAFINADAFVPITPVTLAPGTYSVVTLYDDNYNTSGATNPYSTLDGGGAISFVGGSRFSATNPAAFVLPTILDGGPENRYNAGTFQFAAVPLPTAAWGGLVLLGGPVLLSVKRRRA